MKRIFSILIVSLFVVWGISLSPSNASAIPDAGAITNVEFAELLMVPILNAAQGEMPAETEGLSDEEYFEVLSNILASYGIDAFMDSEAGRVITIRDMVNILYKLAGGKGNPGIEEKVQYMVENEYMPPVDDVNAKVPLALAAEVIANIDFAPIVAEAYSPPERPRGWISTVGIDQASGN